MCYLSQIPRRKIAIIRFISEDCSIKERLTELGLFPGQSVIKWFENKYHTLASYEIEGTMIAIRSKDASKIVVELQ